MNRTAWQAGVLGLAVGAVIGYQLAPRTQVGPAQSIAVSSPAAKPDPAKAVVTKVKESRLTDFDHLEEADLHAQISEIANRPRNKANSDLVTRALQAWTRQNPHAAWQWALAQPSDLSRQRLYTVISEWVTTNPNAAISAAKSLSLDQGRNEVMHHAFQRWAAIDLRSALQSLKSLADILPNTESLAAGLIRTAASRDPVLALAAVSSLDDPEERSRVTASIIETWAKTNKHAALSAARKLQDTESRQAASLKAYSTWSMSDLKGAIAAIDLEPDPTIRQTALQDAMSIWFLREPFAAAEFIAKRGDASLIPGTSGQSFADKATPQEVERLLTLLPDGKEKDDFTRNIAKTEIRRGQYPRAVDLINQTADSLQRDNQLYSLGRTWTKGHLQTLEPWLRLQPQSPDRDLVTLGMVNQLARDDPRAALPWLSFIADPTARLVATKNLAHHWLKLEPAAGQNWLTQGSGLPASHQTKVLENARKDFIDYTFDELLIPRWTPQ